MRYIDKVILTTASLYASAALFASEAYTPIAYGTKSRGMGGVGIANVQGAESALANPALLSFTDGDEISVGATYRDENMEVRADDGITKRSYSNSDEGTTSSYLYGDYHLTDTLEIGIGVTDYTLKNSMEDATSSFNSEIQKRRVTLPLSYRVSNFSIGGALIYEKAVFEYGEDGYSSRFDDDGYGYDLGIAYRFKETGLLLAVDYKSQIDHSFGDAIERLDINSVSEVGIGVTWKLFDTPHKIAFDYKRIDSSELLIDGFASYTQDQDVFAFGYEYEAAQWQIRGGYRYVSDLYRDNKTVVDFVFPFVTTSHYTVGGSYMFYKSLSVDVALLYATYERTTYDYDGVNTSYTVESDPISFSVGVDYTF